ncbi:hypothetical protein HK104_006526, partial [Borealophlyctis nickersoniae]
YEIYHVIADEIYHVIAYEIYHVIAYEIYHMIAYEIYHVIADMIYHANTFIIYQAPEAEDDGRAMGARRVQERESLQASNAAHIEGGAGAGIGSSQAAYVASLRDLPDVTETEDDLVAARADQEGNLGGDEEDAFDDQEREESELSDTGERLARVYAEMRTETDELRNEIDERLVNLQDQLMQQQQRALEAQMNLINNLVSRMNVGGS